MKTQRSNTKSPQSKQKNTRSISSNKTSKSKLPNSYTEPSKLPSMKSLEKKILKDFTSLYSNDKNFYNVKIINEIICNESTHIVALFKDYLIYGDYSEFLQGNYSKKESIDILPKIYDYYESCSVIFPNYIVLPESKYIYKNIQRKQRVIDNQQEQEQEELENKKKKDYSNIEDNESKVFDTQAIDSILNQTDTSTIRQMMGMSNQQCIFDENENSLIYEDILGKINKAEDWCKDKSERKIVNCALRIRHNKKVENEDKTNDSKSKTNSNININLSHVIKGRNYNRITTNMSSMNKISSTTEKNNTKNKTKSTVKNSKHTEKEIKTYTDNKTTNCHHTHTNSHQVKDGIIHSLLSTNYDLIKKTFKDLAKKSTYRNSQKINTITSPNNYHTNNSKPKDNKLLSSLSSPKDNRPSSQNKTSLSMAKVSNQLSGFIIKYGNKKTTKHSKDSEKKISSKQDKLFISHNLALTTRDYKSSMNQEIMTFLDPKQINLKQHIKNSISISHKKTFTSSSLGTATGSLNNNLQQNEEKIPLSKPVKKSTIGGVTHRNERNTLNINYTSDILSNTNKKNKLNNQQSKEKTKTTFGSPLNPKVLKTYTHFQSNSSLNGNTKTKSKKNNSIIPMRKELNIKGIKIKGFDELVSKNAYSNRNNNNSNSERSGAGIINNSENYSSKRNIVKRNKNEAPGSPFNQGYYNIFKTSKKY